MSISPEEIPTPAGGWPTAAAALFAGPGEMRARCRAFDWAATPLGPVEGWPAALRGVIRLSLESGFPMCVYAGPELVCIYNDSCIPALGSGKHPAAPGRPAWGAGRGMGPHRAGSRPRHGRRAAGGAGGPALRDRARRTARGDVLDPRPSRRCATTTAAWSPSTTPPRKPPRASGQTRRSAILVRHCVEFNGRGVVASCIDLNETLNGMFRNWKRDANSVVYPG